MAPHTIRQCIGLKTYLVLALMMLMACGGGGGGGSGGGDLLAGGGIGGTGITIGAISGFGSVIVNDVHYDTKETKVFFNGTLLEGQGTSVVLSNLAKGMVIRVEARYPAYSQALAEQIFFTGNLKGTVQSITAIDSKVRILSILDQTVILEYQNVILDDQTRPSDTNFDFDDIEIGNVLEVSGWVGVDGQIRASYVRKVSDTADPNAEQMIKGNVTDRNEYERWFYINQLKIDMSGIVDDPVPAVRQLVIVHGVLDEDGILVASALEIENELGVEDADSVEIEGIVSQVSSADEFILSSTTVKTDEATQLVGLTPDDIMPGARLLVKGALSDDVLLADEVEAITLADEVNAIDKIDIEGSVARVWLDPEEITLIGLSPLVVHINSTTRIFGDASELSEINWGQHVKILGYAVGLEYVVAGQIKVNKKERPKVKLQGPIGDIDKFEQIISIFGVEIDVEQIIADDGSVIPVDLIDQAVLGDTVNVMGDLFGDSVAWKEIELLNVEN